MSQPHGVCAMPALQDRMGVQVAYALEKLQGAASME